MAGQRGPGLSRAPRMRGLYTLDEAGRSAFFAGKTLNF